MRKRESWLRLHSGWQALLPIWQPQCLELADLFLVCNCGRKAQKSRNCGNSHPLVLSYYRKNEVSWSILNKVNLLAEWLMLCARFRGRTRSDTPLWSGWSHWSIPKLVPDSFLTWSRAPGLMWRNTNLTPWQPRGNISQPYPNRLGILSFSKISLHDLTWLYGRGHTAAIGTD